VAPPETASVYNFDEYDAAAFRVEPSVPTGRRALDRTRPWLHARRMQKSASRGLFIAYVVVAIILAFMMSISASGKLTLIPGAVKVIHDTVGVPLSFFPLLAAAEIAGGVGLLAGLFWPRIGVAAATGLVIYFVGAIVSHLLVKDWAGVTAPIAPLLISATALFLRLKSTRRIGDRRQAAAAVSA
jgi:hypothetical protein